MATVDQHGRRHAGSGRFGSLALAAVCALMACAPTPEGLRSTVAKGEQASERVQTLADAGHFTQADAVIAEALASAALPQSRRDTLAFERERMRRIRLDFSLSRAEALAAARRAAPALSDAQFDAFDAQGLLEAMEIDGERRYFNRAPSNLFRISAEARALRTDPNAPFHDGPYEHLHPHHVRVLQAAETQGLRFVTPHRVQIEQSLTVKADVIPAGEIVRVWIPYPRVIPGQQRDLVFLESEPAAHRIAPESALQRTVYLEKPARAGEPTQFSIRYELSIAAQHLSIDPDKVVSTPPDPSLASFLAEEPPHIVFTDALRLYSAKVVGDETNPARIAQKLFAAVDTIPWAGAREYSTIRNISDYALHAGHADCGQQTLLLIALLRLNGIPARWQSGWTFSEASEDYANLHDWGQVFLAPYGWVPMDVTTGQLDSADPSLRWFYLGSLDAYRIAFNDDISAPFDPPKQFLRSETVDSQRGEVEWRGGNLYFDQWDYGFKAQLSPINTASTPTKGDEP
jgi:transglutaminase-like putative cysteine protease